VATARQLIEPLEVHVSPMRRRHLRSVLRIEGQVYPTPWTHGLFVSELALRSTRSYVVARVGREVVGYAGLMMSLNDGHITTIAVDPEWQRQGVATRLLLALSREALARGANALTLEVRLSHRGAQRLYQRFGFTAVGVRKGYYADSGEDALIMWAHDADQPAYASLLDRLEHGVPGTTVFERPRSW
jgi:ribosomal-protein-alanine N-acetyltransferase